MSFLDEVKETHDKAKSSMGSKDKSLLAIDEVVNELAANIKKQILSAAQNECKTDALKMEFYFIVPALIGTMGPHIYERKTLGSGSGFSYHYEYTASANMAYMRDQLSSALEEDNISVSSCVVGTTTNQGLVASKRVDDNNLGISIEYYESDSAYPIFKNGSVNIYHIYDQFDVSLPIHEERKNGTLNQLLGVKKTISQGNLKVQVQDAENFAFLIKCSFSASL